ncbi:unnamed protein product [Rangifer tarandus platyrhynchus]|uniref:Uncharacterized protein n=2 Tax=Rangifer tarandus platyrhynchus TaxID=3082113 RepID=A0AC59YN13_RANTA|nr:unnamed protein product [Rangifer tarandus platyrhynchus]
MTSADNVSIGEGKRECCPPHKGSCLRAQRGEGGADLRRAAVLNGAGAGEVADVVGHVENSELLQRMIQNLERELKGTIDSFDVRLQHNYQTHPNNDLILYETVPLFDFALYCFGLISMKLYVHW